MNLYNEFLIAFNDFLIAFVLFLLFLLFVSFATYVGMVIYKKIERRRNEKNTTYIQRTNGKTRIKKDKNGNVIEVTNITEL